MKSVITQGATVAKAIEEALKKADMPKEFFVKLLEDAQAGFLGFGAKKAKIALFFKEDLAHQKNHQESLFEKGSYENLFNNPNMKKQIEQQLKDLGLEIKPIVAPKKPSVNSRDQVSAQSSTPVHQPKMHTRPLPPKNQSQPQPQPRRPQPDRVTLRPLETEDFSERSNDDAQPDEFRRKRRPRYYRSRSRSKGDGSAGNAPHKSNLDSNGSDF